ncbi:MAG: nucleoside recognition domain-containing protein [Planctomycetota bacterium]|jgi:hypothetical protein
MAEGKKLRGKVAKAARELLRDAVKTAWDLFKVMVPIIIVVKILQELGAVDYLGAALSPVMRIVGLPGSMGLVWASALVTNVYGGIAAFAALAPAADLTAAQATVICTMMLVAHALPVELAIARKAGARVRVMAIIRIVGALALAWLLNFIYSTFGYLQHENVMLVSQSPADATLGVWALGQLKSLAMISGIILTLLFLLRLLKWLGITALITRLLEPVLEALGMSREAAPITIIGMTLGLSFGGGLIIQEARSGRLHIRDVFFSLSLMGLCHSLIEDTIVMSALGCHQTGILWGRLLFSLVSVYLLVKVLSLFPEETLRRHFFVEAPK